MRVMYLTHQYLPRHVGGTEIYTHGLARRATQAGFPVTVVTYHESPSGQAADYGVFPQEHEGIPVREIHYNLSVAPDPARYEYDNPFTAEVLAREIEAFRQDLVHVMHAMKLSGSALAVCRKLGVPFVVTLCDFWFVCPRHTLLKWDGSLCSGPEHRLACVKCLHHTHGFFRHRLVSLPEEPMAREIRRGIARRAREPADFWRDVRAARRRNRYLRRELLGARRIVALSAFQKTMMVGNGFPAERVDVIEHGLEVEGLAPVVRRSAPVPRLVYIGSLVPHKGPHVVLEALARAPRACVELMIYGAPPETDYGARLAKLAGADTRVRLMGLVPPSELGRVLAEADALVVPSLWYENDPLVVKAAFYVGRPVLASRIGSLAEMVTPGRNGWLLAPGDARAWAAAIERLVADPTALPAEVGSVKTMDDNAREMFDIYRKEARQW
jgi:glycosyltransferase involved in cell wall biosynthesis